MTPSLGHVRFALESRHQPTWEACPLCARSRHESQHDANADKITRREPATAVAWGHARAEHARLARALRLRAARSLQPRAARSGPLGDLQVRALGGEDRTDQVGPRRRPPAGLGDAILVAAIVVLATEDVSGGAAGHIVRMRRTGVGFLL